MFLNIVSGRRRFEAVSIIEDLFMHGKLSFFDTGSQIVTPPLILTRVFLTWLNCIVLIDLGFHLSFIKAATLFPLIVWLSVRADCVLDMVMPFLHSFACSLWSHRAFK